jgi:hypothetical protein
MLVIIILKYVACSVSQHQEAAKVLLIAYEVMQ